MKTKILFIFLLSLISCNDEIRNYKRPEPSVKGSIAELDSLSPMVHTRMRIYSHEGCEYIVVNAGDQQWGTHKGNCKNPIHEK